MKHELFEHGPLVKPLVAIVGGWGTVAIVAPNDARWLVIAFAANGILQVLGLWLLAKQYLWHLSVSSDAMETLIEGFRGEVAAAKKDRADWRKEVEGERAERAAIQARFVTFEQHPLVQRFTHRRSTDPADPPKAT